MLTSAVQFISVQLKKKHEFFRKKSGNQLKPGPFQNKANETSNDIYECCKGINQLTLKMTVYPRRIQGTYLITSQDNFFDGSFTLRYFLG